MIVNKDWFFTITKTAISRGYRFLKGDRPNEETMRNLVDTMVSKNIVDKAKESSSEDVTTLAGHVVASTSAQAIAFQAALTDRTLAVQPHQLPETVKASDTAITLTDTTYGSSYTDPILDISNVTPTIRNVYTHKITSGFSTWLAGILSNISIALKKNITQTATNTSNIAANTVAIAGLSSGTFEGTLPIGSMSDFGGITDPNANFLICDGRSLLRASYPTLFAVISNRFGDGANPGSTFALPKYTDGRTSKGPDASIAAYNTIGKTGGNNTRMLTIYDLPAHKHPTAENGADITTTVSNDTDISEGAHNHLVNVDNINEGAGKVFSQLPASTLGKFDPYTGLNRPKLDLVNIGGTKVSANGAHTHEKFAGNVGYQYNPGVTPQTVLDLNSPFVITNKIIRVL